jgi:hypothetical protein
MLKFVHKICFYQFSEIYISSCGGISIYNKIKIRGPTAMQAHQSIDEVKQRPVRSVFGWRPPQRTVFSVFHIASLLDFSIVYATYS